MRLLPLMLGLALLGGVVPADAKPAKKAVKKSAKRVVKKRTAKTPNTALKNYLKANPAPAYVMGEAKARDMRTLGWEYAAAYRFTEAQRCANILRKQGYKQYALEVEGHILTYRRQLFPDR